MKRVSCYHKAAEECHAANTTLIQNSLTVGESMWSLPRLQPSSVSSLPRLNGKSPMVGESVWSLPNIRTTLFQRLTHL